MGEKNKNKEGEKKNKNKDDQKKEKTTEDNGGGGKKAETKQTSITVILKVDLHCDGCASKVIKSIRGFKGVESVKRGDGDKLTVTGKVDPAKLREMVEQKTHKKVELVSPILPNKDKENNNGGEDNNKKKETKQKPQENKSKEPTETTAVMKVNLHCEGCVQKIHKVVTKTKGYSEIVIDRQKDLVTVKGSMDMKTLAESLKKHLKKDVDIVPPKKEGNDKKEKGSGDGEKGKGGEEGKKNGGGGDGNSGEKVENKLVYQSGHLNPYPNLYLNSYPNLYSNSNPNPYPNTHESGYGDHFYNPHPPQIFSDENPNACFIM